MQSRPAPLRALIALAGVLALALSAAAAPAPASAADAPAPLAAGEFDAGHGFPDGWQTPADWHQSRLQQRRAGDLGFLRVSQKPARMSLTAPLPKDVGEVIFATRYRADGIKSGPKGWDNPLLTLQLNDAQGQTLNKAWDTAIKGTADQRGWTTAAKRVAVPAGATTLAIQFAYGAAGGDFDLDWVRVYRAADAPAGLAAGAADAPVATDAPAAQAVQAKGGVEGELMPQTHFSGSGVPNGWTAGEPWMAQGFKLHPRGFLLMDKINGKDGHFIQTTAPVDPASTPKVRMQVTSNGRAHRVKHTEDVTQRPRLELSFEDAGGSTVGDALIIPLTGFLTQENLQSIIGEVPATATRMRLRAIYHGQTGELTLRNVHVVPATGDEPRWMHKPAEIPAGASAPHPIGWGKEVSDEDRAREPGANVDESLATNIIQVTGADEIHAAWAKVRERLDRGEGVKLLLHEGHYRLDRPLVLEELEKPARDAVLVIEGRGEVILCGSTTKGFEPANWELVDAERRIYRHDWKPNWGFVSEGYYQPAHVLSHRRELLFLGGKRMDQEIIEGTTFVDRKGRVYNSVGLIVEEKPDGKGGYTYTGFRGLEVLDPGEFAVAELGPGDGKFDNHPYPDSILLRLPEGVSTLEGATIEVAVTSELLRIEDKSNLVIRNLTFRHAASYWNNRRENAALEVTGAIDRHHDVLIENVRVVQNNGKGAVINGLRNVELRNVRIEDNGNFGIGFHHIYNGVARNVDVLNNNWRGELSDATIHSTGGMTWSGERMRFLNCRFNGNFGTGWRSDVWVIDVVAEDCEFNDNRGGNGIGHEIGWGPVVHRRCTISGNGGSGAHITSSRDITFDGCRFIDNGEYALQFYAMVGRISPRSIFERDMYFVDLNQKVVLRNSTLTAAGDAALIGQRHGQGSVDNYQRTIRDEYTGQNNHFWHPTRRDVFEATTGYAEQT